MLLLEGSHAWLSLPAWLTVLDPQRLCAYLSAALLIGLGLNALVGWWWADPITALVIAAVAFKEGRDSWHGEACCTAPPLDLADAHVCHDDCCA
jgi:hypothetical protein